MIESHSSAQEATHGNAAATRKGRSQPGGLHGDAGGQAARRRRGDPGDLRRQLAHQARDRAVRRARLSRDRAGAVRPRQAQRRAAVHRAAEGHRADDEDDQRRRAGRRQRRDRRRRARRTRRHGGLLLGRPRDLPLSLQDQHRGRGGATTAAGSRSCSRKRRRAPSCSTSASRTHTSRLRRGEDPRSGPAGHLPPLPGRSRLQLHGPRRLRRASARLAFERTIEFFRKHVG